MYHYYIPPTFIADTPPSPSISTPRLSGFTNLPFCSLLLTTDCFPCADPVLAGDEEEAALCDEELDVDGRDALLEEEDDDGAGEESDEEEDELDDKEDELLEEELDEEEEELEEDEEEGAIPAKAAVLAKVLFKGSVTDGSINVLPITLKAESISVAPFSFSNMLPKALVVP